MHRKSQSIGRKKAETSEKVKEDNKKKKTEFVYFEHNLTDHTGFSFILKPRQKMFDIADSLITG